MFNLKQGLAVAAVIGVLAGQANAGGTNNAPPPGAFLDLNLQMFTADTYMYYSGSFTATLALTTITIAIRNDPGFTFIDDVALFDNANPLGPNLLANPGFEDDGAAGAISSGGGTELLPSGWLYQNLYATTYSGSVIGGGDQFSGHYAFGDGSVQAYDALSQVVATTSGDVYTFSFWAKVQTFGATVNPYEPGSEPITSFRRISTNACTISSDPTTLPAMVVPGATASTSWPMCQTRSTWQHRNQAHSRCWLSRSPDWARCAGVAAPSDPRSRGILQRRSLWGRRFSVTTL